MGSRGQPIRGGLLAWGLGEGLTTLHHKRKQFVNELLHSASDLTGFCEHGNEPLRAPLKGSGFID